MSVYDVALAVGPSMICCSGLPWQVGGNFAAVGARPVASESSCSRLRRLSGARAGRAGRPGQAGLSVVPVPGQQDRSGQQ